MFAPANNTSAAMSSTCICARSFARVSLRRRAQAAFRVDGVGGGIGGGAAGDDDAIAGLQRVLADAPLFQTRGAGPLGRNLPHHARLVSRVDVNPRVGIAVLELHELAFNRHS